MAASVPKFDCKYSLLVQTNTGDTLEFARPFTVEFDIHRNTLSGANVASFRIYNLAPKTRAQIRHDQYSTLDIRQVEFHAGYSANLSIAFRGYINQAWSVREGVNFITQIESYDGGLALINSTNDTEFIKGTPPSVVLSTLAKSMQGVSVGAISEQFDDKPLRRGAVFSGNTGQIMHELSGGAFFIDNGYANVVFDNEYIQFGETPLINVQTGLIGTPVRENTYINLDMIFEPSLHCGALATLESNAEDGGFNGTHKIISLKHRGIISDAVCGTRITSAGLLPGEFDPLLPQSGGG